MKSKEINQSIQDEAKRLARMAKAVEAFASTDATRMSLMRPWHDKKYGVVVATDGTVLVATKRGFDKNADNGDRDIPKWKQVVPVYDSKDTTTLYVTPSAVKEACDKCARLARSMDRKLGAYMAMSTIRGDYVVLSAANLRKVAEVMDADGMTEIVALDGTHPILAKNKTTTIAAMPIRVWKNGLKYNTKVNCGRGKGHLLVMEAQTGRILSAPERSSSNRDDVETLRKKSENPNIGIKDRDKILANAKRIERRIEAEDEIDALMDAPQPVQPVEAVQPVEDKPQPVEDKPQAVEKPQAKPQAAKPRKPSRTRKAKPQAVEAPAPAPSPWREHVQEWRDMTHNNQHDEVRVGIAEWAAVNAPNVPEFAMIAGDFRLIAARDEHPGYDESQYMEFRVEVTDEMLDRIGAAFGEEAKAGIGACL
jgi:hypothetical protein